MASWWYFDGKDKTGPVEQDVLINLIKDGTLNSETLVWSTGFDNWYKINDVDILSAYLESDATPPPLPIQSQPAENILSLKKETIPDSEPESVNSENITAYLPSAGAWRRFFARSFDIYCIHFPLVGILSFVLSYNFAGFADFMSKDGGSALFAMACLPLALACESGIYALLKTTPGKFLLGIRLYNLKGERINGSDYFSRNAALYTAGLGLGIPLISLIPMISQFSKVRKGNKTSYDQKLGFQVNRKGNSLIKTVLFAILFLAAIFAVMVISKMGEKTVRSPAAYSVQHTNSPGFVWTNKFTGLTAHVDGDWSVSEKTSPGNTISTFSSKNHDIAILVAHEDNNLLFSEYIDAVTEKSGSFKKKDAGTYNHTRSGYPYWVGEGKMAEDSNYNFSMVIVKVGQRFWRVATVYPDNETGNQSAYKLQNEISNTIPH